ncbi:hypothetical protein [Haloarcula sp. JP-L23]|uniref:hypothetical protein n=1 Tax=Haloarcula sp. JP-L23 TaxID=2716717 RepID=UPI00140F13E5|nr:hypothetical protein G9465_17930 [Haloarcula sp. JP-L23]
MTSVSPDSWDSVATDDVAPSERSVVQALADGGRMYYDTLAGASDTSTPAVYRTLATFEDVLESANGVVDFADEVMREKFEDLFGTRRRRRVGRDGETLLAGDSALSRWARCYGDAKRAGQHYGETFLNATVTFGHEKRHVEGLDV